MLASFSEKFRSIITSVTSTVSPRSTPTTEKSRKRQFESNDEVYPDDCLITPPVKRARIAAVADGKQTSFSPSLSGTASWLKETAIKWSQGFTFYGKRPPPTMDQSNTNHSRRVIQPFVRNPVDDDILNSPLDFEVQARSSLHRGNHVRTFKDSSRVSHAKKPTAPPTRTSSVTGGGGSMFFETRVEPVSPGRTSHAQNTQYVPVNKTNGISKGRISTTPKPTSQNGPLSGRTLYRGDAQKQASVHDRILQRPTSPVLSIASMSSGASLWSGASTRRKLSVNECFRMDEKLRYQQLLRQFSASPAPQQIDREVQAPIFSQPLHRRPSNSTVLGSTMPRPDPIQEEPERSARIPKKRASIVRHDSSRTPKESGSTLQDLSPEATNSTAHAPMTPAQPNPHDETIASCCQRCLVKLTCCCCVPGFEDDLDSPVIVSVEPATRTTSRVIDSPFVAETWVKEFNEKYGSQARHRQKQIEEERIKAKKLEERRKKREKTIEEQVTERLSIAEKTPAVVEDKIPEKEISFPKITDDMSAEISQALRPSPEGEILVKAYRLEITRKDMHTLAGLNWLNDEIINFYMNMIMDRGNIQGNLKVHAFNTFFYTKITQQGPSSVMRWTRKVSLFSMDLVLVPVHLGMHWCMAVLDMRNKCIKYYDSMGGKNNKGINALRDYLQAEHKDKKGANLDLSGWTSQYPENIPQQMNGSDCGMFACKFAEYASRDASINFDQKHMPYFRRRMVWEILHKKLL
ncbi:SENP2 [Branchiostoma lanceolatum]|uniref:SENP2 protein n=1 Tax=Branchiostoma lanceolatum TaxID=7740 RepID=A0A8J9W3J1_BRALA|nr:SENP2 [Branchiostoma lanceolatum]